MTDALPYTDALVDKVAETIATYPGVEGQGIDARRVCIGLLNNGVGLVDTARRSFLVDLSVHQGVLERLYAAEALAGISHADGGNPVLERLRKAEAQVAELKAEVAQLAELQESMGEEGR